MHGLFKRALLVLCIGLTSWTSTSFAPSDPDPIPERKVIQVQIFIAHEWWLLTWAKNELACKIFSEFEGMPVPLEVQAGCKAEVYETWIEQPVCEAAASGNEVSGCEGYYLYYVRSHPVEREVVVELPPPSVSVFLVACEATGSEIICDEIPKLRLIGREPLTDQHITRVNYSWRGQDKTCGGGLCDIQLSKTKAHGELITFWADSSFGDSSEEFEALLRIQEGEFGWQVDVLSSQWTGGRPAALAQDWQALPAIGEPQHWLGFPNSAVDLASYEPYQYLAGRLIEHGIADTSVCADNGLLFGGYASTCGLEQATEDFIEWQNKFDEKIFLVAQQSRLSPQLLKNLIAQESQFWPGEYAISPNEYGLGRLTQEGADAVLLWNMDFYNEFCPQVISERTCTTEYSLLDPIYQAMLRGALASQVNVTCPDCQYGIDLGRVGFGIEVIAESLLANGRQVGQMVTNLTGEKAGQYSSYEDLWRFTLVNYNAGPGCLGAAISETLIQTAPLDWRNVSMNLVGDCRDAIVYVDNITRDRELISSSQ